jgi:hypothetical protein
MRTLLRLIFAPLLVLGASCADEREYLARSPSPIEIEIEPAGDAGDARVPIVDLGPHQPGTPTVDAALFDAGVADAGRRDAGPRDAGFDARVPDAAPPDASFDARVPDAAPDTSIDWLMPTGEQVTDVSFAVACDSSAPTPGTDCRAWPWHKPLCYRTPNECAAVHESTYCVSIGPSGGAVFTSLQTGASCASEVFPEYALSSNGTSLAWIGADLYTIENGVTRHSLADGSFDTTARQANSVFAQGDQIILHVPDGSLVRYPSWEDMKRNLNGQAIPYFRPSEGAVFGANADTIAALWPTGELSLFRGDGPLPSVQLNYSPELDGTILGVDLDDTGNQAFVLSWQGISTYQLDSGKLLRRTYAPGLLGLQCSPGTRLGSEIPPVPSSPRPGFYYADREDDAILEMSDCSSPFNGPRFYGQNSGPELLMLGSFFAQSNQVDDQRVAPHILVLTSIQPSDWNIEVAAGAGLERIIVNGNANQVHVSSTAPIPMIYHVGDSSLGSHDGNWPTWGESVLRDNLERYTGRAMTEILGCYLGATYTIRNVAPLCALP